MAAVIFEHLRLAVFLGGGLFECGAFLAQAVHTRRAGIHLRKRLFHGGVEFLELLRRALLLPAGEQKPVLVRAQLFFRAVDAKKPQPDFEPLLFGRIAEECLRLFALLL